MSKPFFYNSPFDSAMGCMYYDPRDKLDKWMPGKCPANCDFCEEAPYSQVMQACDAPTFTVDAASGKAVPGGCVSYGSRFNAV